MRLVLFLVVLFFIVPLNVSAQDADHIDKAVELVEEREASDVAQPQKRISDVLSNQGGMKEIKPLDLDAMGDRMLELGDKSFSFLQKGSLPLLVWGMGISVVILFFGIILGKSAVMAGIAGIAISVVTFVIVQFMPETAASLMQGIGSLFGQ